MGLIMKACNILHNVIVEDERDSHVFAFDYMHAEETAPPPDVQRDILPHCKAYLLN